jgi:hypothetical protein
MKTIAMDGGQRSSALRTGALWAATLIAAMWIGNRIGQSSPDRAVAAPPPGQTTATAAQLVVEPRCAPGALDAATLQSIVRDELARQLSDLHPPPAEAKAADRVSDVQPINSEQHARADEASRVVDHAIRAGRWTGDDRRQFAGATSALPPPTVIELQRQLHVAINRGQVALVDGAPPFGPLIPAP